MDLSSGKRSLCLNGCASPRGKSVLDLAMESAELGILHFLIIEKGVNIMQYKNLMVALRTLKATIQHLPDYLKYAE